MQKLTVKQVRVVFSHHNLDRYFCLELIRLLELYKDTFKINTELRRVRFLAQAVHETVITRNGTVSARENLNYSSEGLMRISKFFRHHKMLANTYGRTKRHKANQKAIANIMYADKNRSMHYKLGNIWAGEGYLFRGMFMLQSTGRSNISKDIAYINEKTGITLLDEMRRPYQKAVNSYTIYIIGVWHTGTGPVCTNSTLPMPSPTH
jgi:predicted chitinase